MNRVVAGVLVVGACAGAYAATTLVPKLPWKNVTRITPSASASIAGVVEAPARKGDGVRRVQFARPAGDAPLPGETAVRAQPREGEPEAPTDEERYAYAESVFDSQAFDPTWSRDSSQKLSSAISALDTSGVRVSPVQCRTSLCRVEVRAENRGAGERFVRSFIMAARWGEAGGMVVRSEPDSTGAYHIHVYLARNGTSAPEPPVEEPVEP